jgi:nicotinamidase-related amidase
VGVESLDNPAIVVIDMLDDFVSGNLRVERAARIIQPLVQLLDVARRKGIPVIYSNDAHYAEDFEVTHKWGVHAIKGSCGAQIIPELTPSKNDFVVEKRTYSGFFETGLDSLLRSLYSGKGVGTLILCGLHTDICVRHTSADAFFRGYKLVIAKDGVEALTQEAHEKGLEYLQDVYNAEIRIVPEIIREFEKV